MVVWHFLCKLKAEQNLDLYMTLASFIKEPPSLDEKHELKNLYFAGKSGPAKSLEITLLSEYG